ncbi:MAG: class I SAM-dependent DNA methyltransferase [Halanaerobium sp.]
MSESYTNYFAEIYDDVMKQVPYKFWFKYLTDILIFYKCNPESIIELAAGTGNMTTKLINIPSVGKIKALDLSDAMINKAAEKFEIIMNFSKTGKKFDYQRENNNFKLKKSDEDKDIKLDFVQADMRDYYFEGNYDLVLSFFDSLNYLITKKDLAACFKKTAEVLKNNGLFIFDMNSIERINTIEEKKLVLEGEEYSCFWEDIVEKDNDLWKVRLQICPDNDKDPCYEEMHIERGYTIETIKDLLYKSGFKSVDVYRAFSLDKGSNKSDRLYFIASLNQNRLNKNKGIFAKMYYSFKNDIQYLFYSFKYSFFPPKNSN